MKAIFLFLWLAGASHILQAQPTAAARQAHFDLTHGIALQGYDPVSYFTQGTALRATGTIRHTHLGVQYFFRCDKHLNIFKTTPQAFEPQYGGWCAEAMSRKGHKVKANPKIFALHEGRCYLFADEAARARWLDHQRKAHADAHWVALLDRH